jgi:aspartate racemase
MSWESTATYYREINELTRQRHGGLVSAEILMHSVNFKTIVDFQRAGRWDLATERLSAIGNKLTAAGAACILICTNTMHLVADDVARRISAPLINIIDVTGAALEAAGARRPLLLATRYTMEQGFYLKRLSENSNLTALTPGDDDRGVLGPGGARFLLLDRRLHVRDILSRRPHEGAGLPLHVPLAAHPGRADRRGRSQRDLPPRPR